MFTSLTFMLLLLLAFGIGTLLFFWFNFDRLSRARRLVAEGAPLVDVDSPAEFERKHLKSAINIPFDDLIRRAPELDPHKPVVVSGRGRLRATRAAPRLRTLGFDDVLTVGRARL